MSVTFASPGGLSEEGREAPEDFVCVCVLEGVFTALTYFHVQMNSNSQHWQKDKLALAAGSTLGSVWSPW